MKKKILISLAALLGVAALAFAAWAKPGAMVTSVKKQ